MEPEEQFEDAHRAYRAAKKLEADALKAWRAAGSPFSLEQPNGMVGRHPLLAELHKARDAAARMRRDLKLTPAASRVGQVGKPQGSASKADRVVTPLRAVK